jgi:hypothetical protein
VDGVIQDDREKDEFRGFVAEGHAFARICNVRTVVSSSAMHCGVKTQMNARCAEVKSGLRFSKHVGEMSCLMKFRNCNRASINEQTRFSS